jgi:hypothetical protein
MPVTAPKLYSLLNCQRVWFSTTRYSDVQDFFSFFKKKFGGDDKDRTCDIQLAKLALSQLSYTPTPSK